MSDFYSSFKPLDSPDGSDGKASAYNAGDWVQSLGQEDLLEEEMATLFSILAWKISWTEEPGGLQSTRSQRVGHGCAHMHLMIERYGSLQRDVLRGMGQRCWY